MTDMPILAAYMVPHPPMIVPEVGRGSEHQIEATRSDYFHISPGVSAEGSFARFRAPQVCFRETYDSELAKTAERMAIACGLPAGTRGQRDSHVRDEPSLYGDSLTVARAGAVLRAGGESRWDDRGVEWYYVCCNGYWGWISSKYTSAAG